MSDVHSGGCQCGALRYQFRATLRDIAHCHCSICRRTTGGIPTTWLQLDGHLPQEQQEFIADSDRPR
jgi:hypothetical protein